MPQTSPNHRKCRSTEVGATKRRARFIWVTTAGAAVDHAVTPEVVGVAVRSASEPMVGLCGERFWAAPLVADPGRPCAPCARRAPMRVLGHASSEVPAYRSASRSDAPVVRWPVADSARRGDQSRLMLAVPRRLVTRRASEEMAGS